MDLKEGTILNVGDYQYIRWWWSKVVIYKNNEHILTYSFLFPDIIRIDPFDQAMVEVLIEHLENKNKDKEKTNEEQSSNDPLCACGLFRQSQCVCSK